MFDLTRQLQLVFKKIKHLFSQNLKKLHKNAFNIIINKSTQRAQTSAKAAQSPNAVSTPSNNSWALKTYH